MSASLPIDNTYQDDSCESGQWAPPPSRSNKVIVSAVDGSEPLIDNNSSFALNAADDQPPPSKGAICCSFMTLIMSIPAVIGAWCWPALVIPLLGGTVTAAARRTGHAVAFSVTLFVMICLIAYMFYCLKRRRVNRDQITCCINPNMNQFWFRYGPLILTCIAAVLIMMDPTRHLMVDRKIWTSSSSSMYRDDCETETISCLSLTGWLFTIFATYIGFIMLIIGTMWNANVCDKFHEIALKWRAMRGGTAAAAAAGAAVSTQQQKLSPETKKSYAALNHQMEQQV